jgi:hypothetical protein
MGDHRTVKAELGRKNRPLSAAFEPERSSGHNNVPFAGLIHLILLPSSVCGPSAYETDIALTTHCRASEHATMRPDPQ